MLINLYRSLKILSLAVILMVMSSNAFARAVVGYVYNQSSWNLNVYGSDDGAVFGGGASPSVALSIGANVTVNHNTQNSTNYLQINARTDGVIPEYLCFKKSKLSYADAQKQLCIEDYNNVDYRNGTTYFAVNGPEADRLWLIIGDGVPPPCNAGSVTWGVGNYCSATVTSMPSDGVVSVTNTKSGAIGSGSAVCTKGKWIINNPVCDADLPPVSNLNATKGTIQNSIEVTWSNGTTPNHQLSYRKVGDSKWITIDNVASGWTLNTSEVSEFEFMVRASNQIGYGAWSNLDKGYIRPPIYPQFISQQAHI